VQTILKRVNELSGIKESDTGLAPPALWDLAADKQALQSK
jgi:26S proteasome regulatory subunit T1